jgi:hypothetical protein
MYCHASGLAWLIIMGSGLDDRIYWHFFYNYNQLWQLTIDDCLRLVPFYTGARASSLPLRRITAHTLNCPERRLSDEPLVRMNYDSFITSGRPKYRPPSQTAPLLFCVIRCHGNRCLCYIRCTWKRVSILGNSLTFTSISVAEGICGYRTVA